MSVDRSDNARYSETVQDRGWRQMSARLDREMPEGPGGIPRDLLILLAVFFFIAILGLTYWFSGETNETVRPIARLDNIPIRTIQYDNGISDPISLHISSYEPSDGSIADSPGGKGPLNPDQNRETIQYTDRAERENFDFTHSEFKTSGNQKSRINNATEITSKESDLKEKYRAQGIRMTATASIDLLPLDLLQLQSVKLSPTKEKMNVPIHKSLWVRMSGRLDKQFSQSGLKIGLEKQWKIKQWKLQTGVQFSMLDYFSHSRERSPGSRIDQHLTMREFAFLEGGYSSYNDVLKLAGKTYYAGVSTRLGRGIYSGLYAFAGTGIHRIIGGKNQSIKLSAEGFGGGESKTEDVNALTLVDQGVLSPWMWTMSAGLKWHIRPDLAFTIQYEQPVNRVMEHNTIALDDYPVMYWMELGMSLRLKSD